MTEQNEQWYLYARVKDTNYQKNANTCYSEDLLTFNLKLTKSKELLIEISKQMECYLVYTFPQLRKVTSIDVNVDITRDDQ